MAGEGEGYLKEVKSPSRLKRILGFEVPRSRVEKEIEEIIEGIRREVALPGFRKGKAPRDLIRARFSETAEKEAIEKIIPEAYQKVLEKESLHPALPAEISDMEYGGEGPLTFRIAIELFPEVELKQYKGIKVKKQVKTVEDSDIDREIEALRQRFARFEKLDRESRSHDVVVIDYWRVGGDGKPVRGSRVSNYPVEVGGGGLVKEFDEGLIGVKRGDKKTIDVTYPEDFAQEDMRGQTVRFEVEVKEVGRRVLPQIDQDFAKMLGLDSVESVRMKVKEGLAAAYEEEAASQMKREILKAIIDENAFEVPEGLVNMGLESMVKSYREEFDRSGEGDSEQRLNEIRERLRPLAVNIVKEQFIIDDIARRERIIVEDHEIEEVLQSIADRARVSVDEARKQAVRSEEIGRWRRNILKNKVLGFLLDNADIEQ